MIFKKIKKAFKNIAKGVKKVFKAVTSSKVFKVLAVAAAVVFTAGAAAGALGITGSWAAAVSNTPLIGTVFNAGANAAAAVGLGQGAAGFVGGATEAAGLAGSALPAATTTAAPTTAQAAGVADALAAGSATTGASGGLLGAAKTVGSALWNNPTAMLVGGQMLQSAFTPSEDELARDAERRERSRDWRYGVNNLTGEQKPVDLSGYFETVNRFSPILAANRHSGAQRGLIEQQMEQG